MAAKSLTLMVVACLICLSALGCATTSAGKRDEKHSFMAEITPEQRRADAIKKFEQRRHSAQYSSALSRWNAGDIEGCEKLLNSLLEQDPDDREARRLLADVCLERSDWQAAEGHLRQLLDEDQEDAQSHHSLGLLLEEAGRHDEALWHLARAVTIEPQNELYALSRDATVHQPAP